MFSSIIIRPDSLTLDFGSPLKQDELADYRSSVHLYSSALGRAWSFEPFSDFASVSPELLNQSMCVAEFCREGENPSAAIKIYDKTIPHYLHKSMSLDYIAALYAESGRLEVIEPVLKEELRFLTESASQRPIRESGWSDEAWDSIRRLPIHERQKNFALIQSVIAARLLEAYIRAGRQVEASSIENYALKLDARFPDKTYFFPIFRTYLDDLDRKEDARRILQTAVASRVKKVGKNHEWTQDVLDYYKSYNIPR